jgi:hypothetical protein
LNVYCTYVVGRCAPVFTLIVDTSDGVVANPAKSPATRRAFCLCANAADIRVARFLTRLIRMLPEI